jgi:hypothetical protein
VRISAKIFTTIFDRRSALVCIVWTGVLSVLWWWCLREVTSVLLLQFVVILVAVAASFVMLSVTKRMPRLLGVRSCTSGFVMLSINAILGGVVSAALVVLVGRLIPIVTPYAITGGTWSKADWVMFNAVSPLMQLFLPWGISLAIALTIARLMEHHFPGVVKFVAVGLCSVALIAFGLLSLRAGWQM